MLRPKFALRSLFLLVALVACFCAAIGVYRSRLHRDKQLLLRFARSENASVFIDGTPVLINGIPVEQLSLDDPVRVDKTLEIRTSVAPPIWMPFQSQMQEMGWFKRFDTLVLSHPTFSEKAVDALSSMSALTQVVLPSRHYTKYGVTKISSRHPGIQVNLSEDDHWQYNLYLSR